MWVVEPDRPESFTVGRGADIVVVVSTGLLHELDDRELDAVLAHEVNLLANGDSRVLGAALAPVLPTDEWIGDDPNRLGDHVWNWVFCALKRYAPFGVAVFARASVYGSAPADAGAAELTGSPAGLASALRKLGAARDPTVTDIREWERSVAAADILPPVAPDVSTARSRRSRHWNIGSNTPID